MGDDPMSVGWPRSGFTAPAGPNDTGPTPPPNATPLAREGAAAPFGPGPVSLLPASPARGATGSGETSSGFGVESENCPGSPIPPRAGCIEAAASPPATAGPVPTPGRKGPV